MLAKRLNDIVLSLLILIAVAPLLVVALLLVWIGDFKSPIYFAERVGKDGTRFYMAKIRTMVPDADKSPVISTGLQDSRITKVGRIIRLLKLDEGLQLLNVLKGEMSLVGPRPNTWRKGVELYTESEQSLLSLKPGITDFASIVFSDESHILENAEDPDLAYNQLIRPWKSRLGLFYIAQQSLSLDLRLIFLTALNVISRRTALNQICNCLNDLTAPKMVVDVSRRQSELIPAPPPGSDEVVNALS